MNDFEVMEMEEYFDFEDDSTFEDYNDQFADYMGDYEGFGDFEEYEGFSNYEEYEGFGEYEGYYEADPFLGGLVSKFVPKQLKQMAQKAAQRAASAIGQQIGGRRGAQIGSMVGNLAGQLIREAEYSGEMESGGDYEGDWEAEVGDYELLEEMSFLAHQAAQTDNEEEADEFLGALAGLAAPLVAKAAPALASAAPGLINSGIKAIGSLFGGGRRRRRRRRRSRESEAEAAVVQALPQIAAKTATSLQKQANVGKPITPERVAATLAKKTTEVVANPQKLAKAVQNNQEKARRVAQRGGPRRFARRCSCCGKVSVRTRAPRMA